ncbi:uncharacterized protein LOC117881773 isoform X1 [Trachemys scripta elegans]|uniref:uncharacterized protein LOC117881773 isoform X1 n=2 Tax=Trachemys scripta elegans TaxID=31138 RepID=UPI0015532C72|nr:uncharacterized protein LOC117881773 isoform X1 [Trachemys scripta elegans]XP_034635351.1 uncharacterized protein LOC117881773 isoform X1 [Trachemys scripta elegans]XP_034635359.1 uncharacterized protein LOC117881773 isoform X1 [Trachemys scripta elegans]
MSVLSHPCCATLPLFGDLQDQNVTFVVSMLEGMSSKQDFLKEHLIKTLFSMANSPTESTFNIISFASKVVKWCTSLVKCSLSNIIEATAWIRALQCGNGADAVSALAMAFEDPTCQVVYLVTDALSESASEEICSLLAETGEERPVHTVYLVEKPGDCESSTQKEMEKVAKRSGGSFQVITLHPSRASEEVNPGCTSSIHCCNAISKYPSCSLLMGIPKAHFPVYVCANSPTIPLTTLTKRDLMDWSPEAPHLLRGARVLARRETDGYYYLGHIAQEVKGSRERFLIEFERSRLLKGKVQFRMQETPLYDIIHYEDARRQPLAPGDRVLAPWEAKGERYGPGTVLKAAESSEAQLANENSGVLVNFWNGQTKKVSSDLALRIPLPLSERIILELQMPLVARQMLVDSSSDYPYIVTPGYRASGHGRQDHLDPVCWQGSTQIQSCPNCSSGCSSLCHCCLGAWVPIRPTVNRAQPEDVLIPGTSLTKEELSRKIEEQLSKGRVPISERVFKEEDKKEKKKENVPKDLGSCVEIGNKVTEPKKSPQKEMTSTRLMGGARAMVDIAVHPDTCLTEPMHDDKEESRHYGADPDSLLKNEPALFQSSMIDAPAQHPPRNPPVKAQAFSTSSLQAMFDRVDQSLKKDRLTIESVLRIQRPHSAPSTQKSVTKGATQESLRMMNFNTARIEHRRQQEELRQQKREQKQEAEGLKRQLMHDSRRERSLQRTLQSLEKQLEYNNMARQHMAKLQTARAERSRKESSLQEEEKRKECQRLQFLKAQHLQREELQAEYNQRNYDQDKKRQDMLRSRMQSRQETLEREIQEQDTQQRKHEDAKWRAFQNRDHFQQKLEKECQKHYHLQQYLREQKLLMLRASLLS